MDYRSHGERLTEEELKERGIDVKDLPGFSNYGICSNGLFYSKKNKHFLSSWPVRKGYMECKIKDDNGVKKHLRNHREVAKAFLPNPNGYSQVNHKDENKENNDVSNLEWCTNEYNCGYGTRGERIGNALRGRGKPILALDNEGKVVKRYVNQMEPLKDGIYQANISKVLSGQRKTAGGFGFVLEEEYELP